MPKKTKQSKPQSKPAKARAKRTRTKTSEIKFCPFCNIPFDKSGQHFCTAMREPDVTPPAKTEPIKNELERIIEVLAWANEKGALHFKCPYFEILFPQPADNVNMAPSPVIDDNARAEAGIANPDAVPYKNPIDDPDYYSETQERLYNYQRR